MQIPEYLYKHFVSNNDILCIIGQEEHKIFIEKKFITKADDLVAISVHAEDEIGLDEKLLKQTYNNYLKIGFWDLPCESYFDEMNNFTYYGLNDEKALQIVEFICANLDKQFVINCSAGVSRSAAIGMAILCIKHFKCDVYAFNTSYDNMIKNHYRYQPNKYVFDKIMEVYALRLS